MTKRELIDALEALPCSDDTQVAVYSKESSLHNCFVTEVIVDDYTGRDIIDIVI